MATEASEVMEERRLRVWALAQALKAHGYAVEIAESLPLLTVPAGSPRKPMGRHASACAVTWYGRATGAWWALVPTPDGMRLLEAATRDELQKALRNPAAWPWPLHKFAPASQR
ncbi:hypothetical protein ACIBI3_38620 [Actinomadura luteofluorescens]|uniref:hypothetical protein n=1 Tax=Actinomadura luteofluorescens TaxID=46163 RepID=UPI00346D5833